MCLASAASAFRALAENQGIGGTAGGHRPARVAFALVDLHAAQPAAKRSLVAFGGAIRSLGGANVTVRWCFASHCHFPFLPPVAATRFTSAALFVCPGVGGFTTPRFPGDSGFAVSGFTLSKLAITSSCVPGSVS